MGLYKFAIEYCGENVHEENRDRKKEKLLRENRWEYLDIWEASSTKRQKEIYGTFKEQLVKCCEKICEFINQRKRNNFRYQQGFILGCVRSK